MRGERGMSDVVETTSDEDGGAQGGSARARGVDGGGAKRGARGKRKEGVRGGVYRGVRGREEYKWAIILLFHRGRTPRWR